jgi:hypothetical protein
MGAPATDDEEFDIEEIDDRFDDLKSTVEDLQ